MFDLVNGLKDRFPEKFPKYISRIEMVGFLDEHKGLFGTNDFENLTEYFEKQNLNRSKIFKEWELENKQILSYKEEMQKVTRDYPFSKEFIDLLALRRYSKKTIKAYSSALVLANEFLQLKEFISLVDANLEQFRKYFQYLTIEKNFSDSTIRIARFAIEYYRNEIIQKSIRLDFAYGIRKKEHLPTIFSKEEILKILNSTNNLKHKLILSLLYSAGLRLSEVIHLKVKDIDFEQRTIRVREGKGGKDRLSVLSDKLISDLQIFTDGREGNKILFPSNQPKEVGKDSYLSPRTVEVVFTTALKKSGIKKQGSPHDFRHSFATHLLESGTDIHFIQKLLGHKNVSTTSIYTKLANPKIAGVRSPF